MFAVQAGSEQLLIPALRWTSTAVSSFGLLGGHAHHLSDAGRHRAKLHPSRIARPVRKLEVSGQPVC